MNSVRQKAQELQLRLSSFVLIELICSTIASSTPGNVSLCLAVCPGPCLSPVAVGVFAAPGS